MCARVCVQAFYVKWDEFIEELSKALGVSISKDDQALMKHVLGMRHLLRSI
jgi:hypothetical protein